MSEERILPSGMLIDRHVVEMALEFLDDAQLRLWLQGCFSAFVGNDILVQSMTSGAKKLLNQAVERIEADVEAHTAKALRNREVGKKGGRPTKTQNNPVGFSGFPKITHENPSTVQYSTEQYSTVQINSDQQTSSDMSAIEIQSSPVISKKRNSKTPPVAARPPDVSEVIQFFEENGYTQEHGTKVFNYYSDAGWKDSRGKPVLNWKQKMRGNWMKEDGKTNPTEKPKDPNVIVFADLRKTIDSELAYYNKLRDGQ